MTFGTDRDPRIHASEKRSGSVSCYFRLWPSRCQQRTIFLQFFCLLLL